MKVLKIFAFYFSGIIAQLLIYGMMMILLREVTNTVACIVIFALGIAVIVALGFLTAKNILRISDCSAMIPFILGAFSLIAAEIIYIEINMPPQPTNIGLGGLPNLGRSIAYFIAIIGAVPTVIFAVAWTIYAIYKKIHSKKADELKINDDKEN